VRELHPLGRNTSKNLGLRLALEATAVTRTYNILALVGAGGAYVAAHRSAARLLQTHKHHQKKTPAGKKKTRFGGSVFGTTFWYSLTLDGYHRDQF
jgi:hypothetical protein